MAFKSRRQARYSFLRQSGFLRFEARDLSRIPLKVPYMRRIVVERRKEVRKAQRQDMSVFQWEKMIKKSYVANSWVKSYRRGKGVYSVWKMVQAQEREYKNKHPEYESPWEKRRKGFKDFQDKFERTYKKERDELNQQITRAIGDKDYHLVRELEAQRLLRFGY